MKLNSKKANFGTAPVFFTAISTILGAIMFLRFGYAVGHVGFLGTLGIILFANVVTISTAMAIAEIATNQKVEGGGEYYIISRSFGINIGATIGIALYLSQAISVAFYIIAFAEAFDPLIDWMTQSMGFILPDKRFISIPAMLLLSFLMLKKGADIGMKALYIVVAILFTSLILFFLGSTEYGETLTSFNWTNTIENPDSFFKVFAIVFPAFTGMTAGVGLSGDLKNPKKSIPIGTLSATIVGMIVYIFIAYKLAYFASPEDLANPANQLIMKDIALFGFMIPIGLAAATISSALGSIMVAPRTLQALGSDRIFPMGFLNTWFAKGKEGSNEPFNSTILTSIIAIVFVLMGDVNAVAEIISMFFMITYGSLCLISFLQHFAADPSYRPAFRSRWYISLTGAVLCLYLMLSMNQRYAILSLVLMTVIYLIINYSKKDNEGLAKIFQGVIFQLSRRIQIFLQRADKKEENWRPSVICISTHFFDRPSAFSMMRWISHRFGFGTYIHFIKGYFSKETSEKSREELARLLKISEATKSNVYLDTMISPSFTSAIAQSIQLPSVSGKEINMILFEFDKDKPDELMAILENLALVKSARIDSCILASSEKEFGFLKSIHIWLTPSDFENGNLMILMGYIITGHPEWRKAQIKIFALFPEEDLSNQKAKLKTLVNEGRLPISLANIELIAHPHNLGKKEIINKNSVDADLVIIGFMEEAVKQMEEDIFTGYNGIGNILFMNAATQKVISTE
ncbi:MAG: amino acid permease [Cyclobacteriaceae bacterium]|nr:amino acid permease [Cyclobacteriaceae bacterium]